MREGEVLALMARHQTNPVTTERLSLSPNAVANSTSSIFTKLQVIDRAQANLCAHETRLGASAQRGG
jgi:DNA-binding NarL/FixJ family response regulator